MLTFHDADKLKPVSVDLSVARLPDSVAWVDARSPTGDEQAFLRRVLGVEAPGLERMREIESSSRLYRGRDALFATITLTVRDSAGHAASAPFAFVVTPSALLTARYEELKFCAPDRVGAQMGDRTVGGPHGALITILESIVDHIADDLEETMAGLDRDSHAIFAAAPAKRKRRAAGGGPRETLSHLGRAGDFTSRIGESLVSLGRMSNFIVAEAAHALPPDANARFERLDHDIASLRGHENRLSEKIQFLLDASVGLIGIEQNDIFKVLTIVSVIGIPPTLIASMYGMNFKNIPEYDWSWGYQYGLTLIFLSGLVPLLWFKWRRWW
jgi:magnesium transporter